jgi:hypothetical protein
MESSQPTALQISQPDQTLFKSATSALNTARAYEIDSADMRDMAARDLVKVAGLKKSLESNRKSITVPIDNAKKAVMDLFRSPTEYLDQAETILKTAISSYDREQQRLRLAEQARLEEAARAERARLEADARAAQVRAQEEADRIQAEANKAAAAGKTEDAARLQAEAESRIEQGAAETAVLQQTSTLITAPIAAAPRTTKGVSTRKVWKAEIADKLAFVRYVAAHPEYLELLEANMPAVNRIALALRANCPLEGVRVFEDEILAARAA